MKLKGPLLVTYTNLPYLINHTCISSNVSSSLLRLFFFSSRLSPLSRASRAVASPGGPSRFGASSASEERRRRREWQKGNKDHLRWHVYVSVYSKASVHQPVCFNPTFSSRHFVLKWLKAVNLWSGRKEHLGCKAAISKALMWMHPFTLHLVLLDTYKYNCTV